MIDTNLIQNNMYYDGPYLNPRDTFGWNEELVQDLESVKTTPVELKNYLDNLEADLTGEELNKIKDTPKGRQALYDDLSVVGIKCLGIGKDTKHAVGDATKRLNAIYKHLAPGQYENFAAMKWSYLDPEYLIEDQVILPDRKILCIIEQLGQKDKIMLEKYFRNKKEFDKYLNKTYNPKKFEKGFYEFLKKLDKKESDKNAAK